MTNNESIVQNNSLWGKFTTFFFADQNKSPRRKFYNSLWAVLFGFIICGIVISFSGYNPFSIFGALFSNGAVTFSNKLISVFVAYLIASLAVAICFKSGLFNIGISGQMMMGGFTTLLIFQNIKISGGSVVLALFIAIVSGAFVALLAGMLKTTFNVNEVVSTIMLNWIIFFIIKFVVLKEDNLHTPDSLAANLSITYVMPDWFQTSNSTGDWYSNNWNWVILAIALVLVVIIWIIFAKTTLGYKIKMIGFNKDAADYSGTNKTTLIWTVMSISGAFAGLAGAIWYIGQNGQIDISEQPLLAGFDAIAISLLAFNNPIGIIASSLIYGILNVGSAAIPSEFIGTPREMNEIIIGLMVYISAICIIFSKFNILQWLKKFFILSPIEKYRVARVEYWKSNINYFNSYFSSKIKIFNIWLKHNNDWNKIKKEHKNKIKELEQKFQTKYQCSKFNVDVMSEDDQIKYFDLLAKFKKERDFSLAAIKYYEKNNINAQRIEKHKKDKQKYQNIRNEVLYIHHKYVSSKNVINQTKKMDEKTDLFKIEEALIVSWFEINSIDLNKKMISEKKVIKIKDSIVNVGQKYQMTNLTNTTEEYLNEKGGEK